MLKQNHFKNPNIRLAEIKDVPVIRRMMDEAVASLPVREWFIDDSEEFISAHIDGEKGYTLIYLCEGQIAGYLIVHYPGLTEGNLGRTIGMADADLPGVHHMESACVFRKFRGRGIQQQLLEEAVSLEKEDPRAQILMSTVHPDNQYSRRNIEKNGFRCVKEVVEHGWPRLVMRLDLPPKVSQT